MRHAPPVQPRGCLLQVGERVLLNNVTYSDTECAELCMDYPGDAEEHYCGIWAWCNDQNGALAAQPDPPPAAPGQPPAVQLAAVRHSWAWGPPLERPRRRAHARSRCRGGDRS